MWLTVLLPETQLSWVVVFTLTAVWIGLGDEALPGGGGGAWVVNDQMSPVVVPLGLTSSTLQ